MCVENTWQMKKCQPKRTKEECGKTKTENNDWLSNTVSEVRANRAIYCPV